MPTLRKYPHHAAQSPIESRMTFWLEANAAFLEGMTKMAVLNASLFSDSLKNGAALMHACMNPYFPQEVMSWMLHAPVEAGGFSAYRRHAADIFSETWEKTARAVEGERSRESGDIEKELALVKFAAAPAAGWAQAGTEAMNLGYSLMTNATRQMTDPLRQNR